MATIVLSAVGAAFGSAIGGSVLGLSAAVVGRAVGATVGRVIDQRLLGQGSGVVETGRVDRFRLSGAGEGAPIGQVYGGMRVAGQVIWASRFLETVSVSGGTGKGTPRRPKTRSYSYSVSLAVALCEGEIVRLGRIWADGQEVDRTQLNLRLYTGSETQLPDPKIVAVEGADMTPAYRGTAYVVLEDLELGRYGNRVPQLNFEVFRRARPKMLGDVALAAELVRGVALMPGTGEYALATTAVHYADGPGVNRPANVNTPSGETDLLASMRALRGDLPNCGSVSLVVSWFGSDLRCGRSAVRPKVEQNTVDGTEMPWVVSDQTRATAGVVPQLDGRPVYGGTPADASVVEAIAEINGGGQEVMFYPFVLMDLLAGNGLADPWSGASDQPALPWRGRITLSVAPGRAGSSDRSAAAAAEVAAFFGTAGPGDFQLNGTMVSYTGPAEWSYRRFILHYAHLFAAAGGSGAFCLGSELRGLTRIRDEAGGFPAVAALKALAADVRAIVGPGVSIGYAADWSEYFGYHPQDGSNDVFFNLDPLWASPDVDFIGIDNYMPLSDWRGKVDEADASWGTIYNLDYLRANIEGGEGFEWYYPTEQARAVQHRELITDGSHGAPWVFRYKDIRSWWSSAHFERIGGVEQPNPTAWVAQSKPIRFTEIGCPAIDKGTNEPNKFIDPKSSESGVPHFSTGRRDDLIQSQYIRAVMSYWAEPGRNPVSEIYGAPMIDLTRAHVWAWDARPWPAFPNDTALWSDGVNYAKGHWINGRMGADGLAQVVAEICERAGVDAYDVSELHGLVRGYHVAAPDTARAALQPLMLAHAFDAVERDGLLRFRPRGRAAPVELLRAQLVRGQGRTDGDVQSTRAPHAEVSGRVRLSYVAADTDYEIRTAEAVFPDETAHNVAQSDMALALRPAEARGIAERWLAEARVARDTVRFALPPSSALIGAGDDVRLPGTGQSSELYRIDRVEDAGARRIEAVRVEPSVYVRSDEAEESAGVRPFTVAVPVYSLFLDLPLITGDEVPQAPHVAVTADPWPGSVAVYSSPTDSDYRLNKLLTRKAVVAITETALAAAPAGLWDNGAPLRLKVYGGALSSTSKEAVLNGANLLAIGDGSSGNWELFQFATADLIAPDTYELSIRLRGQLGSDATEPADWPAGSKVVVINGALEQIDLPSSARDLARHYRIGPATRDYSDPNYQHRVEAFAGIGLRPYSPCHLRAVANGAGDLDISWIRRTRIDGDSWSSIEVPLGEDSEAYLLRVMGDAGLLREETVTQPLWRYTAAMQAADVSPGGKSIEVAQLSTQFGPGPFAALPIAV